MECTVHYDYSIDETVIVKAIKEQGVVKSIAWDGYDETYNVVYWTEGNRCAETLFEWEIEPTD